MVSNSHKQPSVPTQPVLDLCDWIRAVLMRKSAQALKLVICLRILPFFYVKHAQDAALSNPCEEEVYRGGKRAQKVSGIRDYLEPRSPARAPPHPRSPTQAR